MKLLKSLVFIGLVLVLVVACDLATQQQETSKQQQTSTARNIREIAGDSFGELVDEFIVITPVPTSQPIDFGNLGPIIRVCVRQSGIMRLIDLNQTCTEIEVLVEWRITGPPGAAGGQGIAGVPGPVGPPGPEGPQGREGPPGAEGAQGAQGRKGSQVPKGYKGIQVLKVRWGLKDYRGIQVPKGYKGIQALKDLRGTQERRDPRDCRDLQEVRDPKDLLV